MIQPYTLKACTVRALLIFLVPLFLFPSCQRQTEAPPPSVLRRLTVYSPHPQDMTDFVVKEFRQRTGIAVTVVSGGTGELLERLRREAKDGPEDTSSVADVLWGGGVESLDTVRDLFAPYVSSEDSAIPDRFKDPQHLWTGFSVIPMTIIYNSRLVSPSQAPQSWSDLVRPLFRGRLAFADPEKSGSAYTALVTILRSQSIQKSPTISPIGNAEAWSFIDQLVLALGKQTLDQSEAVYRGVAAGEYFAGISFETAALTMIKGGSDIVLVYPKEGTSALPDGVALISGAPHGREGRQFIDFVLSRDVQTVVSELWCRRSVRTDVAAPQSALPLEKIPLIPYDQAAASRSKERILHEWKLRLSDNLVSYQTTFAFSRILAD